MTPHPGEPLVLHGRRRVLAASLVLPPLGFALLWPLEDHVRHGRIHFATWIFAAVMLGFAAIGGIIALLPSRLVVDDTGISWSRWGKTRIFRWVEITDIGVAQLRGTEGWDAPVARGLYGPLGERVRGPPMIGLAVTSARSNYKDPVTRAYRTGFTGYEVNIPNLFEQPVDQIVEELQLRWRRQRERDVR